jgi:hypothetical protein
MSQQKKSFTVATNRLCCVCDKPLYGRSDKVFCDIRCKNTYHAEIRKYLKNNSRFRVIENNGFFAENMRNFS